MGVVNSTGRISGIVPESGPVSHPDLPRSDSRVSRVFGTYTSGSGSSLTSSTVSSTGEVLYVRMFVRERTPGQGSDTLPGKPWGRNPMSSHIRLL